MIRALSLLLLGLLPALAGAQAPVYRVDLIVYLDRHAPTERAVPLRTGLGGQVIDLQDSGALAAAGIRLLPEAGFGLETEWNRLRNAQRFQPLLRLSWEQTAPPARGGPRLGIRHGQAFGAYDAEGGFVQMHPVQGSIGLNLGRYLHLDTDLAYVVDQGGRQREYRLRERRRMRSGELHHLDSARLGVLARISRAGGG